MAITCGLMLALWTAVQARAREPVVDPYYANRQAAKQQLDAYYATRPATYEQVAEGYAEGEYLGEGEYDTSQEYAAPGDYPNDPYLSGAYDEGYSPYGYDDTCGPSGYDEYGYPCEAIEGLGDCYLDPSAAHAQKYGPGALWFDVNNHYKWWASVDFLTMWVKGNYLPPLVTTSPPGTSQTAAGVLGQPGTSILFGDDRVNNDLRYGGRIQAGCWLVDGEFIGLESHYYALQTATTNFSASSNFTNDPNAQILARPFYNAELAEQDSLVLAYPNFIIAGIPTTLNGDIGISTSSKVQSAGLGLRHLLHIDFVRDCRLMINGGYRFFRLDEDLRINSDIRPDGGIFLPGTVFSAYDSFVTQNQFHGGYVGLLHDWRKRRFSLKSQLQLAMGNMHEVLEINGQQTIFDGIDTTTLPGGLLAQPTNIGKHTRDQFVLIPEVEFTLGFQVTSWLRTTIGYNFTYVTRVLRPGNEVDMVVNPNQNGSPDPARPEVRFNGTDLWIQGVTSGAEIRF
jgi:hypothetical protein